MLRSLWFKLIGAFSVVIGVMVLVFMLAVNRAVARELDRYVTRTGVAWVEALAPVLSVQYAERGNWEEAQSLLLNPWAAMSGANGQGRGMMGGQHVPPSMMMRGNMWQLMGWHLTVIDPRGVVVAETGNHLWGEVIPEDVIANGTPIMVDGEQVGTLLLVNTDAPLQRSFLSATSRAIALAGLASGLSALLLGTLLFVTIMRPLRNLRVAAKKVAAGDLTTQVPISSRDELAAVGQAFNEMATRLSQQQHIRQQMVADIAHELRTPISVIQGTLEAMLDGVLRPDPSELRDLHTETRRLARLVEDLRTLSLADAGQLTLVRGKLDIARTMREVVGRMTPLAEARDITLLVEAAPHMPTVEADGDRIAQVLTNLIDNALRYTPAGGQVTVHVAQDGEHVHLTVADTGPGIPEEDLPFVFERFWRGDKSRSRHSGGSGLGLAIVKQLVDLHGGTVEVQSKVGEGSRFVVSLPASKAA